MRWFCLFVLFSLAASAAEPPEALRWWHGSWKCTGKMQLPPELGGGSAETKSRLKLAPAVGGFAVAGEFAMEAKGMPKMSATALWAFDATIGKFVEVWVDNAGNVSRYESAGWQGEKWVSEGEGALAGRRMKMRTTIVRKGDREIEVASEVESEPGKWTAMGEDRCKKG